jgi:hypothetical protein
MQWSTTSPGRTLSPAMLGWCVHETKQQNKTGKSTGRPKLMSTRSFRFLDLFLRKNDKKKQKN